MLVTAVAALHMRHIHLLSHASERTPAWTRQHSNGALRECEWFAGSPALQFALNYLCSTPGTGLVFTVEEVIAGIGHHDEVKMVTPTFHLGLPVLHSLCLASLILLLRQWEGTMQAIARVRVLCCCPLTDTNEPVKSGISVAPWCSKQYFSLEVILIVVCCWSAHSHIAKLIIKLLNCSGRRPSSISDFFFFFASRHIMFS